LEQAAKTSAAIATGKQQRRKDGIFFIERSVNNQPRRKTGPVKKRWQRDNGSGAQVKPFSGRGIQFDENVPRKPTNAPEFNRRSWATLVEFF
jgi:hypothetical protein